MTNKSTSASGKIGAAKKIPLARGSWLRFPRAQEQVARISHLGCIKYDAPEGDMDYLLIPDADGTFVDAQARHTKGHQVDGPVNIEKGGKLPPEGLAGLHLAQIAWNALARLEKWLVDAEKKGIDINLVLDTAPQCGLKYANKAARGELPRDNRSVAGGSDTRPGALNMVDDPGSRGC